MNKLISQIRQRGIRLPHLALGLSLIALLMISISAVMLLGANSSNTTTAAYSQGQIELLPVPTHPGTPEPGMIRLCHRVGSGAETYREMQVSRRSEERRVGKECRSRWSPYQ